MVAMEDKRNVRPLLFNFGVALVVSFAGFLYCRFRTRKTRPSLPPPSPRSSDQGIEVDSSRGTTRSKDDFLHAGEECKPMVSVDSSGVVQSPCSKKSGDALLLPEFNDLVKEMDFSDGFSPRKHVETPRSDAGAPKAFISIEKEDYEQEIRHLRNMVRMLGERERSLEVQLMEYYGLKEQETAAVELQNRLKLNNMEAKLLNLKIESLQADNRRLETLVVDHAKVVAELDAARTKIKLLRKKLRFEAEQNKEQILNLQQRVARMQEQEHRNAENNPEIQNKLRRLKDLEGEVEELRRSNMRLQFENSELGRRLESSQVSANSVVENSEVEELKEESRRLEQENEEMTQTIERLQADRCADVEELVYLRWINACLRYELRNYQPLPGKTVARDLSRTLSPKSEEKAKQLILEYATTEEIGDKGITINDYDSDKFSSSQHSSITETGDPDDSSIDSSVHKTHHHSNKTKFLSKLMRLIRGKDSHHQKSRSAEEFDSPPCSSGISPAMDSEGHGMRYATPSQSSSRASMDLGRVSSMREDEVKRVDSFPRSSDVGPCYKLLSSGRYVSSELGLSIRSDQDSDVSEKFELAKYADVFKDSGRNAKSKIKRRSASVGSV